MISRLTRPLVKCRVLCLAASAAALAPSGAHAVNTTWGGGTSTNWSTAGNWSTGAVPGTSDIAVFSSNPPTTNQPTVTLGSFAAGLLFSTPAGGWTLGGSGKTLQIETSGISTAGQTSGTNTITVGTLKLDGTQGWQAGTGGTLAVSSAITFTTGGAIFTLGTAANTGTIMLLGSSAYVNTTGIAAGTVLVNNPTPATTSGTGTGPVNVNGGTLGGSGSVAGLLTVTAAGAISPGAANANDIGTFAARGGLTLNGTYVLDIGTGTSSDVVAVTGTLTLSSTTSVLNVRSLAAGAAAGSVYEILTASSVTGTFKGLADGSTYTDAAGDSFKINYGAGNVTLTLNSSAVPEPSTWVGSLLMLGMLGWCYRRSSWLSARN